MNDRIKCPKCGQETFENPRYYSVRDEMVLFDGKCVNCGYNITVEELYEDLNKRYDFEEDFTIVKYPLENILEKCGDRELNIKYLILTFLLKVYNGKLAKAEDEETIKRYLDKKIEYQEILENRKFSEKQILKQLAMELEKHWGLSISAIDKYRDIISLDPEDTNSYLDLARAISESGWSSHFMEEAEKNYGTWFKLSSANCDAKTRRALENEYLKRLADLYFKRGISRDGDNNHLLKALSFLERVDLSEIMDSDKLGQLEKALVDREIGIKEIEKSWLPFTIQVKSLQLQILLKLQEFDGALKVYEEIDKISPGFVNHYNYKKTKKTEDGEIREPEFFNFYDLEDAKLFASLTKLFWDTGKPALVGDIYSSVPTVILIKDQPGPEIKDWSLDYSSVDNLWEVFDLYSGVEAEEAQAYYAELASFTFSYTILPYLVARSIMQTIRLKGVEKTPPSLVDHCIHLLKIFSIFHVRHFIPSRGGVPTLYGPLAKLIPGYREGMFECHLYLGELCELKKDSERALTEYKMAAEYTPENFEVRKKIENLRTKFTNDLQIEAENLTKIETREIPLDTTKRIISLLGNIKDSFPEHYERTKKRVELYGKELPYDLLNPLRSTAQEFFNKIYEDKKSRKKKSTENYFKELMSKIFKKSKSEDFLIKVEEMRERNIINPYIENLLRLIWSIGSKGSHPPPRYVKEFELEDIEVIISAVVTFLRWYSENIKNKNSKERIC
ncbi:MAG: hypothetical protein MUP17_10000 [candidate division Zixibacteria bacterium]|nr:hypothetical protein [candidate division Zixibacteria bacterium]